MRLTGERLFLALALSLVFATGVAQIRYAEIYPPHGLGRGDSRFYAWMARDFPGSVLARQLDDYRVQRSLPSGIVYSGVQLLGRPAASDFDVVRPFQVYNFLLLIGLVVLWHGIASAVPLSLAGRWLGFLLLFGNWACLKLFLYLAVMTDCTGLVLGALLLYGYVRSSTLLVGLALVAGAFTWPPLLLSGGFMLVFPRRPLPEDDQRRSWHWHAAVAIALVYLMKLAISLRNPAGFLVAEGFVHVHHALLPVSVPIALAQVALGFGPWLSHPALFRPNTYLRSLKPARAAALAAAVLATYGVGRWYSSGAASVSSLGDILLRDSIYLGAGPVLRPGQSLVAHAVFFGLTPLLLIVRWRAACVAAHQLGLGFVLFGASLLTLGLASESRFLLHGFPALVLLAVMAVEDLRFPRWAPWLLTILALLGSKVWFSINHEGFEAKSHPFSYPAQYYFMNFGPWMADEMYVLQGSVALVALLALVLVVRRSQRLTMEERDRPWPSNRAVLAFPAAAAAAIALLAAIELPARAWLARRLAAASRDPLSRPDATLGWKNVPGAKATLRRPEYQALIELNSGGLRGPDRPHLRPAGVSRVLLLGGSASEAYNLPDAASLRAQLERTLNAACGKSEVLNGGVARYSTEQQLAFFESEGAKYQPEVVVLLFHHEDMAEALRRATAAPTQDEDEDQPEPNIAARIPLQLRAPRESLHRWRGSAALRLLSNFTIEDTPAIHRRLGAIGLTEYGPPPRALWPFGPRQEATQAWEQTRDSLSRLAAAARKADAKLIVLYLPARFEIEDEAWQALLDRYRMSARFWKQDRAWRRLRSLADELSLTLIDPRDALRAAQSATARSYLAREDLLTLSGHQIVARELLPQVKQALSCDTRP